MPRLLPISLLLACASLPASAQVFLKLSGQRCFLFDDNGFSVGTELILSSGCRITEKPDGVIRIGTRDGSYAFTPVEITASGALYRIDDGGAIWERVNDLQQPDTNGSRFQALQPGGRGYLSAISWTAPVVKEEE